jgi:hypothetical protein
MKHLKKSKERKKQRTNYSERRKQIIIDQAYYVGLFAALSW